MWFMWPSSSRDTRDGTTVTFSCQAGYNLTGPSSLTCRGRRWAGPVPICTSKSPRDYPTPTPTPTTAGVAI